MFDYELSEAVKIAAFIPPVDMNSAEIAKLRKELRKKDEQQVTGGHLATEPLTPIGAPADRSVPSAVGIEAPGVVALEPETTS